MKANKTIVVKNIVLRKLRNNLRNLIIAATLDEIDRIRKKWVLYNIKWRNNSFTRSQKKRERYLYTKMNELSRSLNRSICLCASCHQSEDFDMKYSNTYKSWFCLNCFKELQDYYSKNERHFIP